ncbi:MAG: ABC transporter permease [Actinomycetota bacterium]|nr:ABC transporter permease [Actinomycetota bacterium]MDQ2957887.1 ABC transporter permease [Actinomycetota bacterium]
MPPSDLQRTDLDSVATAPAAVGIEPTAPPAAERRTVQPADSARRAAKAKVRRHRGLVHLLQLLIAAIFLGGWQLGSNTGWLDPFFFSKPSDIAVRSYDWIKTGYILDDLGVTLQEAFYAFVLGSLAGVVIGFLLGRVRLLAEVFDPYIKMLNALPRVVLAPIFLLWFGLGISSKVAFGITLVFFIVFFSTFEGVRNVDRVLVDNARMLGAKKRHVLRHVLIPSAATWIFSSLHVSVGFAIVGAVVGEYLGASQGVGYVIAQSEGTFDTTGVFAGMIILTVVVLIIDLIVNRIERRLLRWRPDQQLN